MNYWKNVTAVPNCSKRICVLPLPFCPYLTTGWLWASADHPSVVPALNIQHYIEHFLCTGQWCVVTILCQSLCYAQEKQ